MKNSNTIGKYITIFLLLAFTSSAFADAKSSGQNALHPVARADLRYEYENLKEGGDEHQAIFRLEEKLDINEGVKVALRADLPTVFVDEEESSSGLGDSLFQALVIRKMSKRWRHACGLRTIVPTATEDETGKGKWDLAPVIGTSVDLPELGHGSFSSLLLRYRFSVLGESERRDVNQLEFDLDINLHLENRWFAEITSDAVLDFNDGDRWAVPIGLEVGKRVGKSLIFSVEPQYFLVRDSTNVQFLVESRVGVFF